MKETAFLIAITAALALFSTSCQEKDSTETAPKKGSSTVLPPQKKEGAGTEKEGTRIDHVNATEANELISSGSGIVVLDIRTPQEYAEGHIKGSTNIDFKAPTFEDEIKKLDLKTAYLVHCRSGGRSTSSLETFKKLGFRHVIHLDGGFNGWQEKELPVEK